MKDLAMNTKLIVRPIVGCLTHSISGRGRAVRGTGGHDRGAESLRLTSI